MSLYVSRNIVTGSLIAAVKLLNEGLTVDYPWCAQSHSPIQQAAVSLNLLYDFAELMV